MLCFLCKVHGMNVTWDGPGWGQIFTPVQLSTLN